MRYARHSHERAAKNWLAAPAAVLFTCAFLAPLAVIVAYSFGEPQPFGARVPVSLARLSFDNYARVFDETYLRLLWRTMVVAGLGTLACFLLGFPIAYTLATRVRDAHKPVWLAMVVLPFWTSFLLRTFAWRIVLASSGPLSTTLLALGWLDTPLDVLDSAFAVQVGVVYNYLPLMILPLVVSLDRVDPRLREASRDLGAGAWSTLWHITLPLARPGIVSGCLLVFIPLAGEYVTPAILGGARGMMAGSLVASQFLEARNWALGAAQAVVLVVAILAVASLPSLAAVVGRDARSQDAASREVQRWGS